MSDASPVKVLALSGSLRKGSFNTLAIHAAKELAPPGMAIELYDLAPLPMYNDDVRVAGYPSVVQAFRSAIAASDAIYSHRPNIIIRSRAS